MPNSEIQATMYSNKVNWKTYINKILAGYIINSMAKPKAASNRLQHQTFLISYISITKQRKIATTLEISSFLND